MHLAPHLFSWVKNFSCPINVKPKHKLLMFILPHPIFWQRQFFNTHSTVSFHTISPALFFFLLSIKFSIIHFYAKFASLSKNNPCYPLWLFKSLLSNNSSANFHSSRFNPITLSTPPTHYFFSYTIAGPIFIILCEIFTIPHSLVMSHTPNPPRTPGAHTTL